MVTFDGIIFSAKNSLGGVSVYFRELIRRAVLSLADFQVLVHDAGITSEVLACEPKQVVFKAPRLLERFRSLDSVPRGLLHSSYYRTSRQQGVRNLITVYDFIYERYASGPRAAIHRKQKNDAIRRADAVLCISHNTRRDLLEFLPTCPSEKVFVTHLAASEEFAPLAKSEIPGKSKPFVIFIGGRKGYKNFSTAVEALTLTGEFNLICVGGGPFTGAERATLQKALPGRYFHAGQINVATLNRLYNAAVCLIYPSLYEGFGIPLVEAMSAGCPFVALGRSSIPEVAGHAGILLDESDPYLMATAIEACATPDRRLELIRRGFTQARNFSWNKTFAETLHVYRKLLSGPVT